MFPSGVCHGLLLILKVIGKGACPLDRPPQRSSIVDVEHSLVPHASGIAEMPRSPCTYLQDSYKPFAKFSLNNTVAAGIPPV